MALTRAQLLSGDSFTGTPVLAGEVQGVKAGTGVIIALDGAISFDSTTATGVMRLNSMGAYNGYVWPTLGAPPAAGTVLQSDGTGNLIWSAGSIQAGLGIGISGVAPGESYKLQTPVQTGPPAAGSLPSEAIDGSLYWDNTQGLLFIRYNDTSSTQWVQVIPSGSGGGGTLTGVTGTAPIVIGGTATVPDVGISLGLGTVSNGGFVKTDTPVQTGPPAAGTGQLQAIDGSLYWDNTQGLLFIRYNDTSSTQWVQVTPVTPAPSGFSGSFLSQGGQTVTVVNGIITTVV